MGHGSYRKMNDGSMSSSKYHKKDGTPTRAILKREAVDDVLQHELEECDARKQTVEEQGCEVHERRARHDGGEDGGAV